MQITKKTQKNKQEPNCLAYPSYLKKLKKKEKKKKLCVSVKGLRNSRWLLKKKIKMGVEKVKKKQFLLTCSFFFGKVTENLHSDRIATQLVSVL